MKIRGSDNKSKLYSDKISSYAFGQYIIKYVIYAFGEESSSST